MQTTVDQVRQALTMRDTARKLLAAYLRDLPSADRGEAVVVCVTLGTGIGGGLVAGGQVYRGAFGLACEYGHMTLVPDGRRCACGNRGCWEMYASGTALARDARELAEVSPVSAHALMRLADGDLRRLTGPLVTEAARQGDASAV